MRSDSAVPSRARLVLAGAAGNIVEWYDFAVYRYLATVIGVHVFPSADPAVSLIAAFGGFAAGFLVRPLGGLLFGRIGDLVGRKRALTLSLFAMAVPTVLIGCLAAKVAFHLNTEAMALMLVLIPVGAWLSERLGRKPLLITGATALCLGAIPVFHLIHTTDPATMFLGEAGFVLALALFAGGTAAANVELIPRSVRCTTLGFAYNASVGWFGGTTPMIAAWLIKTTGDPIAPADWIAAASAVSLITAVFFVRETRSEPLC